VVTDPVVARALPGEVRSLLSALSDRERQVLVMRFGLGDDTPRTLEEISEKMELTRERIRQIERTATAKLRHPSVCDAARSLLAS
jgi:RNA polymerase primary sigma factor